MESAFAWIQNIVEWLGQFIPRKVLLDTTEGAIKFVTRVQWHWTRWPERTSECIACTAGAHWYWPYTSKWIEYPMARQTERLETQTLESTDRIPFIVSGALTFAISDLMMLVPTTYSAQSTIKEIAATALHDVCCELSWDQLQTMQQKGTLKTALKNEAKRLLKDYGVEVLDFRLNSLARCRVYRVSQATASEDSNP